jgi:hypothetical protein
MSSRDVPTPETPYPSEGSDRLRPYAPEDLMDITTLAAALRAPGTPAELAHADEAVAAMAAAHAEAAAGVVVLADRRSTRPAVVAAGATVGAVVLALAAGTAAAAFSGALPEGLQRAAHQVLGAPDYVAPTFTDDADSETSATGGDGSTASGPFGPAATIDAPALLGLCQAYGDVKPGDPQAQGIAYQSLAEAAAAADKDVAAYCAPVLASASPSKKPTDAGKPSDAGKPTAKPSTPAKPTQASSKPADPGQPSGVSRPSDVAASTNAQRSSVAGR